MIQGVFLTGPPLKGGPVQNQVKVPRLVLPLKYHFVYDIRGGPVEKTYI